MSQILIEACVTTYPDGGNTTQLRKSIFDDDGHLLAKYFLTDYGEWKEVLRSECLPPECYIKTSIHEKVDEADATRERR